MIIFAVAEPPFPQSASVVLISMLSLVLVTVIALDKLKQPCRLAVLLPTIAPTNPSS